MQDVFFQQGLQKADLPDCSQEIQTYVNRYLNIIYRCLFTLPDSSSGYPVPGPFLSSKQSPSSLSTDRAPLPSGVSCIRDATPEEMSPGKTCPRKTSEEGNRRGTESTEVPESSCGSQRKRADFSVYML